jgi:hypothetical protein
MIASARVIPLLAALAAILLPPSAFGHSTEFILAKVTPQNGRVLLELTADYGGNPMIGGETEARAVLSKVLRVRTGGGTWELSALAPLRFERRTQIDSAAPIPHDPISDAEPHQILCALWSWKSAAEKIAFEVPPDAGQTLILWTPPKEPGKEPRWIILLGGDASPEIAIPHRRVLPWLMACGSAGLVGISVPAVRMMRRKDMAFLADPSPAIGNRT